MPDSWSGVAHPGDGSTDRHTRNLSEQTIPASSAEQAQDTTAPASSTSSSLLSDGSDMDQTPTPTPMPTLSEFTRAQTQDNNTDGSNVTRAGTGPLPPPHSETTINRSPQRPNPDTAPGLIRSSTQPNSPVRAQAALGRGPAPASTSNPADALAAAPSSSHLRSASPSGIPSQPNTARTMSSAGTGSGHSHGQQGSRPGHRSMPSTSHSISFSDAHAPGGNQTETESVFSGAEEEHRPYSASTQQSQKQSQPQGAQAGQTQKRPKVPPQPAPISRDSRIGRPGLGLVGGLRPVSTAGTLPRTAKSRDTRSRSRMRGGSSSSSGDENSRATDRTSISVLPPTAASANVGIDDDAVEHRDRGEELVRRRMKERKREKKEAEKRERKRREEELRKERQNARQQKAIGSGGALTSNRESMGAPELPMPSSYEERPSFSRRSTDPNQLNELSGPKPTLSRSSTMTREPSGSTAMPTPYSPSQQSQSLWPPPPTSDLLSATPTPASPYFPQYPGTSQGGPGRQSRSASYAPSSVSTNNGMAHRAGASDVFSDGEQEEESDKVPELHRNASRDGSAAWRDEVARSIQEQNDTAAMHDHPEDLAEPDQEEEDAEGEGAEEEEEEEEDDESTEDVEYTLKDRQDAINIEHPFGLPIWKPALYKKSRTINRNTEKDLHLAPSSAAERHLLPGNILWTLLFGWWLALLLAILSGLLSFVPFGGAKYGRVLWELGGYLFWPFGKYVERYEEGDGSEGILKGYDEMSDLGDGDGDETVYDAHPPSTFPVEDRERDVEDLGRTWGRRSGNSTTSANTVRRTDYAPIDKSSDSLAPDQGDRDTSTTPTRSRAQRSVSYADVVAERAPLLSQNGGHHQSSYGATSATASQHVSSGSETEVPDHVSPKKLPDDEEQNNISHISGVSSNGAGQQFRVRALGRLCYWVLFYVIVAPVMLLICLLCWGGVFTIPMAKLLWSLVCNLGEEPLALHFRSPSPYYHGNNNAGPTFSTVEDGHHSQSSIMPTLEAGQRAPRHSRKTYDKARDAGRFLGPNSEVILCTYKAVGLKYYKYTVDGTNIIFINLLPLILFVIVDFFFIEPFVEHNHIKGFLALISGQAFMFTLALLSVIPLSYFIGMAVASISAQSSIGMGAVINATFGSIIEIILYSIALTQGKGKLVEGSIVGSLIAGVLLMPGLSMIGGAFRRKEQRFNAKSAGVTSTMLIMAIIGILTPTLFYEIYGTFQLTCQACPTDGTGPGNGKEDFTCRRCFYEHVDPVDDDFYKDHVKGLSYYCAVILVLSYLIGLWFSLRTHASQIWQNSQHVPPPPTVPHSAVYPGLPTSRIELPHRHSAYKRIPQALSALAHGQRTSVLGANASFAGSGGHQGTIGRTGSSMNTPLDTPGLNRRQSSKMHPSGGMSESNSLTLPPMQLPAGVTQEEYNRAFQVVAATASAFHAQGKESSTHSSGQNGQQQLQPYHASGANHSLAAPGQSTPTPILRHQPSHIHEREVSKGGQTSIAAAGHDDSGGHGGHDAPNWSRFKSYSVLLGCTILYAIIAEILVDVVDVVLDGSGIPEKFLGITLFALVPNTTEFMNAISFAMNGNIALSMEIGSAYALQVCLLQIPAMIAFTSFYAIGKESMIHRAFTLVFPRWDALAIMFSVFLLTYTYIEARSNYYRGSILVLSYMVLMGGFYAAPSNMDTEDDPLFANAVSTVSSASLSVLEHLAAIARTLFSR